MMRFYFTLLLLASLNSFTATAQQPIYSVCEDCWIADSLGNHRAVVQVLQPGVVARVAIPWRRRDQNPQDKNLIVTDAQGTRIVNVSRGTITREAGEIYFEPRAGVGKYYVYYLPYKSKGRSNYPVIFYPPFIETATPEWKKMLESGKFTTANALGFQAIDELNSYYPMEVIATSDETKKLLAAHKGQSHLIFPEDRLHPVKMKYDLPARWLEKGPSDKFIAVVSPGENFSFQLGLYAMDKKLEGVRVAFSDLKSRNGNSIPSRWMSCLNTTGTNWDGKHFEKTLDVDANTVQPLWCLIDIPGDARSDVYEGTVSISMNGGPSSVVHLSLKLDDHPLADGGVNEPWKQTRLTWLNSTLAVNDEVIEPYAPLILKDHSISMLGRTLEIGANGLPTKIQSYFTPEMTSIGLKPTDIISSPFEFIVEDLEGRQLDLKGSALNITERSSGKISWVSTSTISQIKLDVQGQLEFDGYAYYSMKLTALEDVALKDIRMTMPLDKSSATYMMGLGQIGGTRPASLSWKWDVATKNQDGGWIGNVNGGLQFSLRDENYVRPLNTNFYLQKPLILPSSWGNDGRGGIDVSEKENTVWVNAYSGARTMKKGDVLYFNFTLLVTPFHVLNTDFQWKTRFYHRYSPVDTVIARGSTVINIHHANAINPYINYPFIRTKEMKDYIDEAHRKGLKVKIYNTVRELSNRAYETHPMRSLGTEIYSPGAGGGFSWLQEHLGDNYIAAWFVPELKDAAVINSGMSRWHNYYVEGMNWLVRNIGIDGIYLDDVAFDRTTMKRIRRVLKSERGPGIIDLHSANQYNKRDGFNNSANLYLEHFPYLSRLWFGEYFDYDKPPDFWLTEVSGIPFGLMGEMLEKGGNKWRGMLYGMTNRMPYDGNDPSHIWKVWDTFGMEGTEMIGYWVKNNPVKTNRPDVLATVYKKKGAVMVSIASWAKEDVQIQLEIDWKALGLTPKQYLEVSEIIDFQSKQTLRANEKFFVQKGKGLLMIVK